jgi:NADPH:quinone reductase-like Zn-dependent oxidoreductase
MHAMLAPNSDPGSLTGQTVDIPEPAQDELLVQVRATALTAGELGWPETWPAVPA